MKEVRDVKRYVKRVGFFIVLFSFYSSSSITINASEGQVTNEVIEIKQTGWIEKDGNWFYYDESNSLLTSQFIMDDYNDLYYLGIDGTVQIGFIEVNDELYYAEKDGKIRLEAGWLNVNSMAYFLKEDGTLYRNEIINFEHNKVYYSGIDGSIQNGEFIYHQERYFADSTTGTLIKIKEAPESTEIVEGDSPIKVSVLSTEEKREAGVIKIGNDLYYVNNNGETKTDAGWIEWKNKKYYARDGGKLYHNQFISFGPETMYYMNTDGSVYSGVFQYGDKLYYGRPDGKIQKSAGWIEWGSKKYFANEVGNLYHNQIINFGSEIAYYMNTDGSVYSGVFQYGDKLYYGKPDGKIQKNAGWIEWKNRKYFANEVGNLYHNQFINFGSEIAYYMNTDGSVYSGVFQYGDKLYYGKPDGKIQKNAGWIEWKNRKYYANEVGNLYHNQFISFGPEVMYYMNTDGSVYSGVFQYGDKLFYGKPDGKIQKSAGWINWNNKEYFADEAGNPYKNTFISFGPSTSYYMGNDGSKKTGWLFVDNFTYYLKPDGIMARGETVIDGVLYSFRSNGILNAGWRSDGTYWYYYDGSNKMLTDWQIIEGEKYFFNSKGQRIGNGPVKKVIDVSEWQANIDWDRVRSEGGIDKVILRCGYGSNDSQEDKQFARNVSELRRLGIPFSIYLYSYGENGNDGIYEADFVYRLIKKYKLPSDIEIYYDIENNGYGNTLSTYEQMIPNFINRLHSYGYNNVYVYSYTYYLETVLNSPLINPYVNWVADYYYHCNYTGSNYSGWQYSSEESVPGIKGKVDMNVWFN